MCCYQFVTALHSQTAKEVVRNDQLLKAKERELSDVKANLCMCYGGAYGAANEKNAHSPGNSDS